jgi:hypothetical protein
MTMLMQALEPFIATFDACGHAHEVRVSFGSTSNRENEKFEELFRRADDSLIQHKRQLYSQGRINERRGSMDRSMETQPFDAESTNSDDPPSNLRLLS